MIRGIDVGTSVIKTATLGGRGEIEVAEAAATPRHPSAVVEIVRHLVRGCDVAHVSVFRRALVDPAMDRFLYASDSDQSDPRFLNGLPTSTRSDTAIEDPYAPAHRWRQRAQHATLPLFDAWLAEQLTEQRVVSAAGAFLTGAWSVVDRKWDRNVLASLDLEEGCLPAVAWSHFCRGGWILPFSGDRQCTALASAVISYGDVAIIEVGTALAVLYGDGASSPEDDDAYLALAPPPISGYAELVDPHFARRFTGTGIPLPFWMTPALAQRYGDDTAGVICSAMALVGHPDASWRVSGGLATGELISEVRLRTGAPLVASRTATATCGALAVAMASQHLPLWLPK